MFSMFMLFVEITVKTVRVSDWKSVATSGQEQRAEKMVSLSNSS